VVTLDYMLPYLNGLELLAIIRARADWKHVPVLMLTAKSQETDIAHALQSGAAGTSSNRSSPRSCARASAASCGIPAREA
jgi:CheY-like chemotaxis protein